MSYPTTNETGCMEYHPRGVTCRYLPEKGGTEYLETRSEPNHTEITPIETGTRATTETITSPSSPVENSLESCSPISNPPDSRNYGSYQSSSQHGVVQVSSTLPFTRQARINFDDRRTESVMSSGRVDCLESIFSLAQPGDQFIRISQTPQSPRLIQASLDLEPELDDWDELEDPENVHDAVVGFLWLDRYVESNSLPFLLQASALWMARFLFEPRRKVDIARQYIFKKYTMGEEFRQTYILLANISYEIARSTDYNPANCSNLSMAEAIIRWKLTEATAQIHTSQELGIKDALGRMFISVVRKVASLSSMLNLMQLAAPVFRRACPDPLEGLVNLPTLFATSPVCLRDYSALDVLLGVLTGRPMFFRYNVEFTPEVPESLFFLEDGPGPRWAYGIPDRLVLTFAQMNALLEDVGPRVRKEVVDGLEEDIKRMKPIILPSTDPSLGVARMTVQQCWFLAALIYLHMGLRDTDSTDVRIAKLRAQFMRILASVKPKRNPDAFLVFPLVILGIATHKPRKKYRLQASPTAYRYRTAMSERDSVNNVMQRELERVGTEIEDITDSVAQMPNDDPNMPRLLARLAKSHRDRFELIDEPCEIDQAIKYATLALSLTPEGHPTLPLIFTLLGGFHGERFERLQEKDDSDKQIEYLSAALALTPDTQTEWSSMMGLLAIAHDERFGYLGDLDDLEKAIEYGARVVQSTPEGNPVLSERLANLGVSYNRRFERLGDLGDIEEAIEYKSRALKMTPDGHPHLSSRFAGLAVSHGNRFERLGELADLEKAIEYDTRALSITPDGHRLLPTRLANLGISLNVRFRRLGELDDLAKAIEYFSRALTLIPDDHPYTATLLGDLGASHGLRYQHSKEMIDIKKAIEYQSRAFLVTPNGHSRLPHRLHNLGVCHGRRFGHTREWDDLEKVIEYMSCALELIQDGDPLLLSVHYHLASFRASRYRHTGNPPDLQDVLISFRVASQSSFGSPRDKFRYATRWVAAALAIPSLRVIEAYQTAIDLLPQFVWLGAITSQRYEDLSTAGTLAVDAAAAAIQCSEYRLALEWLDHARCVVWNQSLMLRSPLDHLHASHPDLASRLQNIATRLHVAGSESRDSRLTSTSLDPEQAARDHRRLAQQYNQLLAEARALPGFEDFLQPMKANRLVHAARYGPIVVINCHKDRCDALVVMPGQDGIRHIPLPNFNGGKAQLKRMEMDKSMRNSRQRERGVKRRLVLEEKYEFGSVLASLWYNIVHPVIDSLGYIDAASSDSLPHITWCPTGALSFLPLHAAGDYSQPQSRVFDYVISSYTPTLTALLSSTPCSLTSTPQVLGIGQPFTPRHTPLPGTAQELEYVKNHMPDGVGYTQLMDKQATISTVLNAMKQHNWAHLACHANQNIRDPTKSGFFLYDGILDLTSINQQFFNNKGLAYLSACQTATGDEQLPDEAIHLASGMLVAGYSSVIATMWSVVDDDAPFVANEFYGQLKEQGKLGTGEAGRALHYAVQELRERLGEKAFRRWVPYIHIGS